MKAQEGKEEVDKKEEEEEGFREQLERDLAGVGQEVVCRRTWQKLGLLVQKGNCALFDNRVPDVDNQ